jgi:cell division protein FtsZ
MREMGKAMMGTGEASGEKRALTAAEAAIANPLIDDSSMKGARGLLISITGGRDLTLYEVDEAASRIREEVDKDANIIVGATFDEGLEGIIRVSVVATGIDHLVTRQAPSGEQRMTELTQKLRADSQRMAERIERIDSHPAPRTTPLAAPQVHRPQAAIDQAATAAVAAALAAPTSIGDVTIRSIPPKPSLFMEPAQEQLAPEPLPTFIPPQPERTRAPRMPRIDEFPVPAQREMRAKRGEPAESEHPEKRRMSLLQRLASVGLGRREESIDDASEAAPTQLERPQPRPQRPQPQTDPISEYARRTPHTPPVGLDPHGRQASIHNLGDDDQLDIPAFLRRQAK